MCYLAKHKGIDIILRALSSLPSNGGWTYTFAGQGPMSADIRDFIENSPNGRNVRYIGKVEPKDTGKFYRDIDVFVIASSWPENQPLTILEAMACGCAVLASDAGGCAEMVDHSATGFLFHLGNPTDLSSHMGRYIMSPRQAAAHGLLGRRRASAWSICYSVKRLVSEYFKLCRQ
jgi:glycosyltransferase involved in cell wall biosynthesis